MRSLVVIALGAKVATAAPATEQQFDDCKARRRALTEQAMAMTDADARGRVLASAPSCRRNVDGSMDVIEGQPIALPETTPFTPHLELAANVGAAYGYVVSNEVQPAALGPYVELGASYLLARHFALGAVASYSRFHDSMVVDPLRGVIFDVREASYSGLLRASARYDVFAFGGGFGVEYAVFPNTGYAALVPCIELYGGYTFARTGHVAAQAIVVVSASRGIDDGTDHGADLVSSRAGIGLTY
jgi:hypothetical protein